MCTGRVTWLLCGHRLVYSSSRCPKKCETPQGEVVELRDTCAECHPPYRMRCITIEYDLLREKLMVAIRMAEARGDLSRAKELSRKVWEYDGKRGEELRRANIRGMAEDVVWPGKLEP